MPKRLTTHNGHKPVAGAFTLQKPITKDVPLSLVLPPLYPMRETMREDKLEELIQSMKENGLINSLAVKPEGKKYRALAGHRRLVAAGALGWSTIRCTIYPAAIGTGAAVKAHENVIREDVNPAEESKWLWHVLENECGGDVIRLCEDLHMRKEYVENRLNLMRGDADVFTELANGNISIAVAQELNMVKEPTRRVMYLRAAVDGGASARVVREWRAQGNAIDAIQPSPPIPLVMTKPSGEAYQHAAIECEYCGQGPADGAIETMFVHRQCRKLLNRALDRLHEATGDAAPGGTTDAN